MVTIIVLRHLFSCTVKCVVYMEHGSKNQKGVIHQVHLDNMSFITHYADSTLGERCFVYLMELYVSKLFDVAKEKDEKLIMERSGHLSVGGV